MAESPDHIIVRLAAPHGGIVRRRDLRRAGVGDASISRRLASGVLERIIDGVYVVGALRTDRWRLHAAGVLFPTGALSHRTAGRLHGFPLGPGADGRVGERVEVQVDRGKTNRVDGMVVHETRRWLADDIVELDGLRVTSPARTLLDLTPSLRDRRLRHLVETQIVARNPDVDTLVAAFMAHARRGRSGTVRMRALLESLVDDQPVPESELEVLLLTGLAERGIVGLIRQFRAPFYDGRRGVVDAADPNRRIIFEADGRAFHQSSQAVADDHRRDRLALAAGWIVVRVGWRELTTRRSGTLDEIAALVAARDGVRRRPAA